VAWRPSSRAPSATTPSLTRICSPRSWPPPGSPNIKEKLKTGYQAGKKTFKVYIDGFNLLPYWKGDVKENPRPGFLYWSDEGDLMALRYSHWKIHFMETRAEGCAACRIHSYR